MQREKTLLERVSEFSNLYYAYRTCRRGKKHSVDYQRTSFAIGEKLKAVQEQLCRGNYQWGGYKEFYVHDPKRRLIMCAPFLDRVVHHALCQVIEPELDRLMFNCVYACRKGRGNRAAVIDLGAWLDYYSEDRFVMKLDVEKYFASINHRVLLDKLSRSLSDNSLEQLLISLLESQKDYRLSGKGIPIGNLSSQLLANFYLASADEIGVKELGKGYFRYMDDIILLGREKKPVYEAAKKICAHIENDLLLHIPFYKRIPLGKDPVPFLGYAVDHKGMRILSRTRHRFAKKLKREIAAGKPASHIAQMKTSFASWADLV